MRLGTVIGRVTLTQKEPVYTGGCLLIVQPWTREQFAESALRVGVPVAPAEASHEGRMAARPAREGIRLPLPKGSSLVVYDELGAGQGSIIGYTEGAEASQPFTGDAPVDAYCACIVDQFSYEPPK